MRYNFTIIKYKCQRKPSIFSIYTFSKLNVDMV